MKTKEIHIHVFVFPRLSVNSLSRFPLLKIPFFLKKKNWPITTVNLCLRRRPWFIRLSCHVMSCHVVQNLTWFMFMFTDVYRLISLLSSQLRKNSLLFSFSLSLWLSLSFLPSSFSFFLGFFSSFHDFFTKKKKQTLNLNHHFSLYLPILFCLIHLRSFHEFRQKLTDGKQIQSREGLKEGLNELY